MRRWRGVGDYTLYVDPSGNDYRSFATVGAYTGQVRITAADTAGHRVAGTFTFAAVELGKTAIVHVTEGPFRVRYQ